jgi:hypothetical protein
MENGVEIVASNTPPTTPKEHLRINATWLRSWGIEMLASKNGWRIVTFASSAVNSSSQHGG